MSAQLEVVGLAGGYGKVIAFRAVSISLEPAKVLAVLGPNGAGKTTLMMTLAGLLPAAAGHVQLNGESMPNGKSSVANKAGIVLVPDDRALFSTLTVRENIDVARLPGERGIDDVIDMFPALQKRLKVKAGMISGGEQQMLAMARGIVQRPKVLLIDEMSMGLAPIVVESLLPIVRQIADFTQASVILVEQHIGLALEIADEAMVLVHGNVSLHGTAASVSADPDLLERAYLGG